MTTTSSTNSANLSNWKNVNNWHWIERDCTEWAYTALKRHLIAHIDGLKEVKELKGDASVNQRKGRVKQVWDLSFDLELDTSELFKVTDAMSDTPEEDLEVSGPKQKLPAIKKQLWKALDAFRAELYEVHGKPLLLECTQHSRVNYSEEVGPTVRPKVSMPSLDAPKEAAVNALKSDHSGIIEDSFDFAASPQDLFSALTQLDRMMAWSRGSARLINGGHSAVACVGTQFSLFGDAVTGVFRALNGPLSLCLDWRLREWTPPGYHSSVLISLQHKNGKTTACLKQTGVPMADLEMTRANWRRFYWEPMQQVFGY